MERKSFCFFLRQLFSVVLCFCFIPSLLFSEKKPLSPVDAYQGSAHPLDPLSRLELSQSLEILRKNSLLDNGWFLQTLYLQEPDKNDVFDRKKIDVRHAFALVLHYDKNESYECLINLAQNTLEKKTRITRGQPALIKTDYSRVENGVRADKVWQDAMRKRGFADFSAIHIETWAPGNLFGSKVDPSHRLARAVFYYRAESLNPYGRPIEGISIIFDLTENRVAEVIDTGIIPVANNEGADFVQQSNEEKKAAKKAVKKAAKKTVKNAVKIKGHEVSWKNWRFRFSFHPREGLVLHLISFEDKGYARPILYRGSLSEMVVPYGDADPHWFWRAAFDEGHYALGSSSISMEPGIHAPTTAQFYDGLLVNETGSIETLLRVIAFYERETDPVWLHYDYTKESLASHTGKELVVQFNFAVGNYDYGLQWVFHEAGSIEGNVLLMGIIGAKGSDLKNCGLCKDGTLTKNVNDDPSGLLVDKNLIGAIHQHFFNFRLNFAIDGLKNSIAEVAYKPIKQDNLNKSVFTYEKTLLTTEIQARRPFEETFGRKWWIFNPNQRNQLGHFPGYMLTPGPGVPVLAESNSDLLQRASFVNNQLWVTSYHPEEMHAAGEYPNQGKFDGLQVWTERNASLDNQDLVLWHTFGVTHLPMPEDWPVMPTTRIGFQLKPMGFFRHNPTWLK